MRSLRPISRRGAMMFAGALAAGLGRRARAMDRRPAVVELFTSQGCSSCPPADDFMQDLVKREDVIALSFHVDYWDYLGWRDTLGSPACSQRQYDYAKSRGDMDVYTPQMIIDGKTHYVGSHRKGVDAAIHRSLASTPALWIPMSLEAGNRDMVIEVGAGGPAPQATIWLMGVTPRVAVKIEKGENAGRDVVYCNVVRSLVAAGTWNGEAARLTLPAEGIMAPGTGGCIALLQTGHVGPVIGSATWGQIGS